MSMQGKTQLLITFVATPEKVARIDRLVASHASWMAASHPREGSAALLSYDFSKGPELAVPLDPGSEPTGNTRYVLSEVYESADGVAEHWKRAQSSWSDFPELVEVVSGCNPQTLHAGGIAASLW